MIDHDLPEDPVARLARLKEQRAELIGTIDQLCARAYFEARMENRFEEAVQAGFASRSAALRMTRNVNEERGRQVRWRDALDPTRSTFTG